MKNFGVHVPDLEPLAIFKGVVECLVELRGRQAVVRPRRGTGFLDRCRLQGAVIATSAAVFGDIEVLLDGLHAHGPREYG